MKLFSSILVFLLLALGCNSIPEDQYDQLEAEYREQHAANLKLKAKADSLEIALDFCSNGAPKLLQEIVKLDKEKLWGKLIKVYKTLRENFPASNELDKATPIYENAKAEYNWSKVKNSNNKESLESYIENNPEGKYVQNAKAKIQEIKVAEYEKRLNEARSTTSENVIQRFLDDYPSYGGADEMRKRIIELEVLRIIGDQNTANIPSSQRTGNSYSSNAQISITNNTGYTLTIRYLGPSIKRITIPAGGYKTVYLSSGSYKIAATAGGLNYAGYESYSGEYSAQYYISRSRY